MPTITPNDEVAWSARAAKALRDFGYPDFTNDEALAELQRLKAGESPSGICGMFMKGWLEEQLP